jgi:hemoglobin
MDVTEEQISALVRQFYESARADPTLGPIFDVAVTDWDAHLVTVADFWSHALLGTSRYQGHPFPFHRSLPIRPEHFDQWLALFVIAADSELPPAAAEKAKAKANHMAKSFRAGLFPYDRG